MGFDRITDENYDGLPARRCKKPSKGQKATAAPRTQYTSKKVSVASLQKTGIFPIRAGDFRHFLAEVAGFWSLETALIRQESPYFKGFSW
jgi:hypothetical protein